MKNFIDFLKEQQGVLFDPQKHSYSYEENDTTVKRMKRLYKLKDSNLGLFDYSLDEKLSASLNHKLNNNLPLNPTELNAHQAIIQNIKKAKTSLNLFSGVHKDNAPKQDIITNHHISTSQDIYTAKRFANVKSSDRAHIIHIHIKPGDKIVPMHSVSIHPEELEVIVPKGTKLLYRGSTDHHDQDIGHFTVHHLSTP